jgi:single-strand DNA-binding protein
MEINTMADLRMPDINKVEIAGRLTRDPEVKYIQSGTRLCNLSIVCSRKYKTKGGETKEETLFVNANLWGEGGKWVSDNLSKGDPVLVEGSLKSDEWEDKETGQKRTAIRINAQRVQSLVWNDRSVNTGSQQQQEDNSEGISEDSIPF